MIYEIFCWVTFYQLGNFYQLPKSNLANLILLADDTSMFLIPVCFWYQYVFDTSIFLCYKNLNQLIDIVNKEPFCLST